MNEDGDSEYSDVVYFEDIDDLFEGIKDDCDDDSECESLTSSYESDSYQGIKIVL